VSTYFIADTHFGHAAIIKYQNRPFKTVVEMDAKMIKNWNKTVRKGDIVYMLGDFALCGKSRLQELAIGLNGSKYLIMGNHDSRSPNAYLEIGFARVYDRPIIIDNFWMLSHEPLYVNENMPYANIFGHVHNNPEYADYGRHHFCVSVERINYTPISFEEIKQKMGVLKGE
jgi:calcineurin-like phosphoesterase family protein